MPPGMASTAAAPPVAYAVCQSATLDGPIASRTRLELACSPSSRTVPDTIVAVGSVGCESDHPIGDGGCQCSTTWSESA